MISPGSPTTLPAGCDATLTDVTEDWGTLSLMGPKARDVLAAVTEADVSNAAFPFGHVREIEIAGAYGAGAARHLCRRTRLGTACADRRDRRGVRRADGGGQAARTSGRSATGRWNRLRLEKGYRAWALRHHAQRHAVRGRARLGGEAEEEHRLHGPQGAGRRRRQAADEAARRLHRSTIRTRCWSGARRSCATARSSAISPRAATATRSARAIGYGYVRNADGVSDDWLRVGAYELVVANERVPAKIGIWSRSTIPRLPA